MVFDGNGGMSPSALTPRAFNARSAGAGALVS
jgi:hypothetical protein